MIKNNLLKNIFLLIETNVKLVRVFFLIGSLFIVFYDFIPFNNQIALFSILVAFVFQILYLVFLILNKEIYFLSVHYSCTLIFIYVICIYHMFGKQDVLLFFNFLLHCLYIIATVYYEIVGNENCPKNFKKTKQFENYVFLDNFFKNKKVESITYLFLKDYDKILIIFFFFSNLQFYMSGDLHFIFWVSVFGIVFNLIVTFIKNKSEVFKSIVKKADYCCIGSYKSETILLIVSINSGASIYKEQLRIDGILKCTTDEQVKAIVRLRELEQTPFETLIKNYYSITGSFNFKTPTKIPVVEKQEVLFKESLFNPPQPVIQEITPQIQNYIDIDTSTKGDFQINYSSSEFKKD